MNSVWSHTHVPTNAIFSLDVWLSHALFSKTGLLGIARVTVNKSTIVCAKLPVILSLIKYQIYP